MTTTQAGRTERDDERAGAAPGHVRASRGRTGSRAAILRPGDWAWRAKIRANPRAHSIYRSVVGSLGFVIVVAGLLMVPFPGPGWLVVFIGVSIWASEFHWARRLHTYGVGKLKEWNAWVQRKGVIVQATLFVLTCLFVNAFLWTSLKFMGIPGWVPDQVETLMHTYLAL